MAKELSRFIADELRLAEWNERESGRWVKEGVALHIVPAKLNKMYYLTTTKMSDTISSFVSEAELLQTINR